mgnify:CR=1 FL=1
MPANVTQKVITMSDATRKNLADISTMAKLEGVKITDSSMIAWALKTLRDSVIEMKTGGLNLKPIFLDGQSFRNKKQKKNKFMED